LGNKTRTLAAASVALGSFMLEAADRLMALTLGAWLRIGGLVLFVVGSPALKPLHPVRSSLGNRRLSLGDPCVAVKERMHPSILLTRIK